MDQKNQDNNYPNGSYQGDGYPNDSYQGDGYSNGSYQNNPYQNPDGSQGYGGGYPPYQQYPPYQPYQQVYPESNVTMEEPMSVGEWMICLLLMMIPCANIVLMFVWAFSKNEKKSKSNYFKASLIFCGIITVFYLVIIMLVGVGVVKGILEL